MNAIHSSAASRKIPATRAPHSQLDAGRDGECLTQFDARYAGLVASWVGSDRELTWLAPGTVPPLTAAKVWAWGDAKGEQVLFRGTGRSDPVGYGELHRLPRSSDQWWIGHVIVDPALRRGGLGRRFVDHILGRAFGPLGAEEVLLVVFPENRPAIRCYERSGFVIVGTERRHFKAPGREHLFLRMVVTRSRFQGWDSVPAPAAPARNAMA